MWYFDEEKLLLAHYKLIEQFGGSHGVRDIERVRSALETPKMTIFEKDQYKTLFEKSAVYIRNIISDHPFVDGNKRTGISAGIFFLEKNNVQLSFNKGELEDFAVKVAVEKLDITAIAKWLEAHSTTKK